MILIDSIYIHNSGGKLLLEILINWTRVNKKDSFFFLFDSRLPLSIIAKVAPENYKILKASENNRIVFYQKEQTLFSHFFCFSNVPPPIKIEKPVTIYFHNDIILDPTNSNIGLIQKLKFRLKKIYINVKNQKQYNWAVQTSLMKDKLIKAFGVESKNISIFPFFDEFTPVLNKGMISNTFLYVANYTKNKNHKRLIKSFMQASIETNINFTLKLTLEEKEFKVLLKEANYLKSNFELINLGILDKKGLVIAYEEANFFIFPSLKESFGLPLIEASNFLCFILASDLEYVHEVIKPSLTFDPYSVESISNAILKAIEIDNLPETKVLVENKLDNFMNYIIN
jgi:glycosyltransferase involved in cell wall biosynthesis